MSTSHLPGDEFNLDVESPAEVLAASLAQTMSEAWRNGKRPVVEEYFEQHPELEANPEAAVQLIYEEITLRRTYEKELTDQEIFTRFPKWKAALGMLLECDRLIEPTDLADTGLRPDLPEHWPNVGTSLGAFRLLAHLGTGTIGKTFLASDPDLADRPVVLKLTARGLGEHLSLARILHTNVVPLYAAPDFPDRNLRALCMPYLGGTSLDRVFAEIRDRNEGRPTGQSILDAIDRLQLKGVPEVRTEGPARQFLGELSFPDAMTWIAIKMAEALAYAHAIKLVHMDVKPANVLIAADGTPMLLDFHLAREPIPCDVIPPRWVGGTPHYLAPEQKTAMDAVRYHRAITTQVDGRADIYSLGCLLREALQIPRAREGATTGLFAIIAKCTQANPRDRYRDATSLAEDLIRNFKYEPLDGAQNHSVTERASNWIRRNLRWPTRLELLGLFATTLLFVTWRTSLDRAKAKSLDARDFLNTRNYEQAIKRSEEGLAIAWQWPMADSTRQSLRTARHQAVQLHDLEQIHEDANLLRFLGGPDPRSNARASRFPKEKLREAWQKGMRTLSILDKSKDVSVYQQLIDDISEFITIGLELNVQAARDDHERLAAHQESLDLIQKVESELGPSILFSMATEYHAKALGKMELAEAARTSTVRKTPITTAAEYRAVGMARLREGKLDEAVSAFEQALERRPDDLWAKYDHGMASFRLGHFQEALTDFDSCTALRPKSPDCFYNRGRAYESLGQYEHAILDYQHAITLRDDYLDATISLGLLQYQLKHETEAEATFQKALSIDPQSSLAHFNLAQIRLARGDQVGALKHLDQASSLPEARSLRDRIERSAKGSNSAKSKKS
jgi:serine/threonine protein kinase/Flp pilus assembly protein TadD